MNIQIQLSIQPSISAQIQTLQTSTNSCTPEPQHTVHGTHTRPPRVLLPALYLALPSSSHLLSGATAFWLLLFQVWLLLFQVNILQVNIGAQRGARTHDPEIKRSLHHHLTFNATRNIFVNIAVTTHFIFKTPDLQLLFYHPCQLPKFASSSHLQRNTQHICQHRSHYPLHLQDTGSPTTVLPSMPVAEVCIIISPSNATLHRSRRSSRTCKTNSRVK